MSRNSAAEPKEVIVILSSDDDDDDDHNSDDDDNAAVFEQQRSRLPGTATEPSARGTAEDTSSISTMDGTSSSTTQSTDSEPAARRDRGSPPPPPPVERRIAAMPPLRPTLPPPFPLPSFHDLQRQCWACSVPLKLDEGQFCMYTMHKHPVLQAPCCFVCAEKLAALEMDQPLGVAGEEEEKICHGCAKEVNDTAMVSCSQCSRQYCPKCLACAYGAGYDGWKYARKNILATDANKDHWKGPCCQLPAALKDLVHQVEKNAENVEANRTLEVILEELQQVHTEHQHTITLLDGQDAEGSAAEDDSLQYAAETEHDTWRKQWTDHLRRLEYHEATLQDELERVDEEGLVDLSVFYWSMGMERPVVDEMEEPAWVASANRAMNERDNNSPAPVAPFVLGDECYDDVEDLDAADQVVSIGMDRRKGFRRLGGVSAEAFAEAKACEEAAHPELVRAKKVTEHLDCRETKREDTAISNRGFRSDEVNIVQSRRKRTRRAKTAKRPLTNNDRPTKPHLTAKPPADRTGFYSSAYTKSGARTQGTVRFDPAFLPPQLKNKLKDHQMEGVQFLFQNCFGQNPGGCVLAHCMGLGKTCTTLSFLFAATTRTHVQSVLILVPTNTIYSWKSEFDSWIGQNIRSSSLYIEDLDEAKSGSKVDKAKRFMSSQGPRCLLVSHSSLTRIVELVADADMVIIDEAHACLGNSSTKTYKTLLKVKTRLRVGLTGTPISNNLVEYHNLMSFFRPGLLPDFATFERLYIDPIKGGLTSDCSNAAKLESDQKAAQLFKTLKPYVNRKDATELVKTLPPLQQCALYISPSKLQQGIYRSFKIRCKKDADMRNFFRAYQALAPINNHPATLLRDVENKKYFQIDEKTKNANADDVEDSKVKRWWRHLRKRYGTQALSDVAGGYKVLMLLHILRKAEELQEKVLVFSGCLKTLDFVEDVLQSNNWHDGSFGPSGANKSSEGGWNKDSEFFRIDGSILASERSRSINKFNESPDARVFLLSVRAAGLGITLTAATRVVLMETDFNPSISTQAIFRSYRYGQTKPVFVYRFLTRGTMEEKIYARCITKTGLACRVIDKKSMERDFSGREIADLQANFNWVQCDRCKKWRVLLEGEESELPTEWHCAMNSDPKNNTCSAPQRSDAWYEGDFNGEFDGEAGDDDDEIVVDSMLEKDSALLVERDPILQSLLELENKNNTKLVAKYKFQQSLLSSKDLPDHSFCSDSTMVGKSSDGAGTASRHLCSSGDIQLSATFEENGGEVPVVTSRKDEGEDGGSAVLAFASGGRDGTRSPQSSKRRRIALVHVSAPTRRKRSDYDAPYDKTMLPQGDASAMASKTKPQEVNRSASVVEAAIDEDEDEFPTGL